MEPETEPLLARRDKSGVVWSQQARAFFTWRDEADKIFEEKTMVNYILLYKIRKRVKKILKDKISDGELATTKTSCLGCLADDISWEVYYLLKEKEERE